MSEFKIISCLCLGLLVGPLALAHQTTLPHEHGHESSLIMMGVFCVLLALATSIVWTRVKRGED